MSEKYDKLIKVMAKNIKEHRKSSDLSQFDMAAKYGFNYRHYQRMESGKHSPNLKTLCKLAEILGIEVQDFFKE